MIKKGIVLKMFPGFSVEDVLLMSSSEFSAVRGVIVAPTSDVQSAPNQPSSVYVPATNYYC